MAESHCAHVTRELEDSATPLRRSIPLAEPRSDGCMDTKPTTPTVHHTELRGSEPAVSTMPRPSRSGFGSPIRRPSRAPSRSRTSSRALPPPPLIFGLSPIRRTLTTPDRAPTPPSLPSPVTSSPVDQAGEDEMPVLLEQSDPEAHPSLLAQHQTFLQDVNIPSGLHVEQLHKLSDTEQQRYLSLFGQDKCCSICSCPLAEPTTLFDEVASLPDDVQDSRQGSVSTEALPTAADDPAFVRAFPCRARHIYHGVCIAPWLDSNTTCPMCREDGRAPVSQYPALPAMEPPPFIVDVEGDFSSFILPASPLFEQDSVNGEIGLVGLAVDRPSIDDPVNMLELDVARPSGMLLDLNLSRFQTQLWVEPSTAYPPSRDLNLGADSESNISLSNVLPIASATPATDAPTLAQPQASESLLAFLARRLAHDHYSLRVTSPWLADPLTGAVLTDDSVATRNELPTEGVSDSWIDRDLENWAPQMVETLSPPPPTPPLLQRDVSAFGGELQDDLSRPLTPVDAHDSDNENTRSLFSDDLEVEVHAVLLDVKQPELSFSEWLTEQENSGRYR